MSLQTIGWGDTLGSTCRSGRPARATWSSMRVALHTFVRRRIRAGMSPFTSSSSDIRGVEGRASRASGATCKGWDVAPRADPERHARAGMSLRTRMKRDMDWVAASPDRSSKATFTLLHGAPRALVGRHAAATSATSTRETVATTGPTGHLSALPDPTTAAPRPTHAPQGQAQARTYGRSASCESGRRASPRGRHRVNQAIRAPRCDGNFFSTQEMSEMSERGHLQLLTRPPMERCSRAR